VNRGSEDPLTTSAGFPRVDSDDTLVNGRTTMANTDETNEIERKRSHGIGGAGNMRLKSAVDAALDAPDPPKEDGMSLDQSLIAG